MLKFFFIFYSFYIYFKKLLFLILQEFHQTLLDQEVVIYILRYFGFKYIYIQDIINPISL